jgi:hypothetical protein
MLHAGFIFDFFDNDDGGEVFPKPRLPLNGLYDLISQETELFVTTAVRTSNPEKVKVHDLHGAIRKTENFLYSYY